MKRLFMINKLFTLLIFCVAVPLDMRGQIANDALDKMNEIKLDESFVYGEASEADEDIAKENAILSFLTYANDVRIQYGNTDMIISSDIDRMVKYIKSFEGNKHCVLVYIPRKSVLELAGHPRNSESPITPNPKTEPKKTLKPNNPPLSATLEDVKTNIAIKPLPQDMLNILAAQGSWLEIKGLLEKYKGQGKIKETGLGTEISEIPVGTYRLLIDDQYRILAFLAPVDSESAVNLKTNQADNESHYPNCKVIVWLR